MKVYALLSWFDEAPEHLTRCVTSLAGFADVIVALDGAYSTFPGARAYSPMVQCSALHEAARKVGLTHSLKTPHLPWTSEVAKRAALFELALQSATSDDWFLIIDGDMELASFTPAARPMLEVTEADAAEVNWHDVQVNGVKCSTQCFRSMFRALPGLTVERTHYLYTVPCAADYAGFHRGGRRFLWHQPNGHISPEPALDLTGAVTLHHYNSQRDPDRKRRALRYYKDRDARTLETAGDWR